MQRDDIGRYIVALPFNEKELLIRDSRLRAFNPLLRKEYSVVIRDYLSLGHMSKVETHDSSGFYLPHYAVIKASSSTTKVRVVFNGSAKSTSGILLNDALKIGPTIQNDIFSLLLRFRLGAYVLTEDIKEMYRQVLVRSEGRR